MIIVFLICRSLNKLFMRCKMGYFLKDFALKSYFILILFEGNTESFTYFLFSDLTTLFYSSLLMKVTNLASIIFLFGLLFVLLSIPFILRYTHAADRKIEFYDKSKNSFKGATYFMIEFGMFNIFLGSAHILY